MPVHWVEFEHGFWLGKTELTNAQYERFDPQYERHEYSAGDNHPVVNVSWEDARKYCRWLSKKTGRPVRLPSETEWECACRGGTTTEYWSGDEEADLARVGWYDRNPRYSDSRTHSVAQTPMNPFGLLDMHGNVWEWCEDRWHDDYEDAPDDGSAWVEGTTEARVCRGGCWNSLAAWCRSAYRRRTQPSDRWWNLGFRPAISVLPDD
jgi:formylglycine-generating enzyme required for sulfatase activity